MDQKKTLQWLAERSEELLEQARSGDTTGVNRWGSNAALKFYFDNVSTLKSITPETFARQYPQLVREADEIRVAWEQTAQVSQHDNRLATVEAGLEALQASIAQLVEQQTSPAPEEPKSRKKTKKQASVEDVTPESDEPEDEGEESEGGQS